MDILNVLRALILVLLVIVTVLFIGTMVTATEAAFRNAQSSAPITTTEIR